MDDTKLRKNIEALAQRSPRAARAIESARDHIDIRFIDTDEGVVSAELGGIALASKRGPKREAERLVERVDPRTVACCALVGFGMGYHCSAMLDRLGSCGVVVCFEPDVELLRAVLGRVDFSGLFSSGRFFLVTDPDDSATLGRMFVGIEAIVALGVEIVAHPPSAARLGESGDQFGRMFRDMLKSARTHVITTLANSSVSFRNALMNLDHYASSAGISSLKDACTGSPAIVVSAGPSLERNLDLLSDPGVRDSVVVIAVQTVLKTMLGRGIRPHFVAALDYHELSKRFYEGLSASDVEGIRLIVEPKANPAILDAFPGEVLCVHDELLDSVLGEPLIREMGEVNMGGTVAHLCYYFARYLGCDPVIFIGQDLGFTDGQYYASGAAIHQVWSGELNAHNTLEMMEWQRIVRMRPLLRKKTDVHGRAIYADEQMSSYLAQFESDFQKDQERGLCVIDASEGGVRKAYATPMALSQAISRYGQSGRVEIPSTIEHRVENDGRKNQIQKRLDSIILDCQHIARLSDESIGLLSSMLERQRDQPEVNRLIGRVQGIAQRVAKMKTAFSLCESVNQVGVLNRMKRDRLIGLDRDCDALGRQRQQIQRDMTNVQWTRDAAKAVAAQLVVGRDAFLGLAPKETNELGSVETDGMHQTGEASDGADRVSRRARVHACVMADPEFGGLGIRRDLRSKIGGVLNTLQLTIARLDRAKGLDGITIITPDPDAINEILAMMPTRLGVAVVGVDPARFRARSARIGSARVQSKACWRGSIGMLCVYDEQVDPGLIAPVLGAQGIDACAIVGADWAMVDPGLVDETVRRYRCQDTEKRIAFSQAPPGLGTMVVDRVTMESLASSLDSAGPTGNHFATIGALLGYIPISPQFDPIAKGMCVEISPAVRDAGVRVIADTPMRIAAMRDAYQSIVGDLSSLDAGSLACVSAFGEASKRNRGICPSAVVLETCTGRLASGDWGMWKRNSIEPIERPVLSMGDAHTLLSELGGLRDDATLVFDGVGDPLMHPKALDFVQLGKEDSIACVEMRTDLLFERFSALELLDSGMDILSVDLLAETRASYAALAGIDRFEEVYSRVQTIFDEMRSAKNNGERTPWFVPRITRCDALYDEIEPFFDRWLMLCGSAVIDPIGHRIAKAHIQPITIPKSRQIQMDRSTMFIRCDGVVVDRLGRALGGQGKAINAFEDGISLAYQRACSALRSSRVEPKVGIAKRAPDHAA